MSTEKPKKKPKPPRKMPKYPKAEKGRPSKLTPEVKAKIVQAIQFGNYVETAAAMAGITKETFYDWLRKGAKEPGIYREFSDAVERAQAESEARDLARIDIAAHGRKAKFLEDEDGNIMRDDKGKCFILEPAMKPEWTAAAWRLERRFPQRWGRTTKHEHTGKDGGPMTFTDFINELEEEEAEDGE